MTEALTPDYEMANQYFDALTGNNNEPITFQFFNDKDKKSGRPSHRHIKRSPAYAFLHNKQNAGYGVYAMVNAGDGKGRSAINVVKVRALFVDLDGSPWEAAAEALKPHMRVESSPGRWHLYWLVEDCSLDQFKPIQQAIARRFEGDKSCCDLSRVLRVPGFYHMKKDPVLTKLVEVNDFTRYTTQQVIDGLGLVLEESEAAWLTPGKRLQAKENGFYTEMPLYHGTGKDIKSFDLTRGGETSGSPVGQLGVSAALDRETAEEFARLSATRGRGYQGLTRNSTNKGEVLELVHRAEKPASINLTGNETNHQIAATVEGAWDNGYDSILFNKNTTPGGLKGRQFVLVKDPSQLRKITAKFDPKKISSPELLAGLGLGFYVLENKNKLDHEPPRPKSKDSALSQNQRQHDHPGSKKYFVHHASSFKDPATSRRRGQCSNRHTCESCRALRTRFKRGVA